MGSRTIAAISLLLLLLLPEQVTASGELRIGGALVLWEEGHINEENLNGDAAGVRLRFADGTTGSADRIVVRSRKDGDGILVERFQLSNMIVENREFSLAFSNLDWRDLHYAGESFLDLLAGEVDTGNIHDFGRLKVDGLSIANESRDTVTVDTFRLVTRPVRIAALPDRPLLEGTAAVRGFVMLPARDAVIRHGYDHFLELVGRDSISVDMDFAATTMEGPDRVDSTTTLVVDVDGLGEVGVILGTGMLNSTLRLFEALDTDAGPPGDEMLEMLIAGMTFNKMELRIVDSGLLDALVEINRRTEGASRREQVERGMRRLALLVGKYAPQTWRVIAAPVQAFLETGGALTASLRPNAPVPASAFAGFAASPDVALSILGFDILHQPR